MRRNYVAGSILLMAVFLTGCGRNAAGDAHPRASAGVHRLRISQVALPRLPVADYVTLGTYPAPSGNSRLVASADASIHTLVKAFERKYARSARPYVRMCLAKGPRWCQEAGGKGEFRFFSRTRNSIWRGLPERVSASSLVVSALIPTLQLYPGGTDGMEWFSLTVQEPAGRQIHLRDLFRNPSVGMKLVARETRHRMLSADPWLRAYVKGPDTVGSNASGFNPSGDNYSHFALTVHGLVIGFDNLQLGYGGPLNVTIPYAAIDGRMSKLGKTLVFRGSQSHRTIPLGGRALGCFPLPATSVTTAREVLGCT